MAHGLKAKKKDPDGAFFFAVRGESPASALREKQEKRNEKTSAAPGEGGEASLDAGDSITGKAENNLEKMLRNCEAVLFLKRQNTVPQKNLSFL